MAVFDQLQEASIVQDTWHKWTEYRLQLTAFLCDVLSGAEHVVIVGAGRCDDIDLAMLEETGKKISLVDIDKQAMQLAVSRVENADLIDIIECSLDGSATYMYREFCENLVRFIREFDSACVSGNEAEMVQAFDEYALSLLEGYDAVAREQESAQLEMLPQADAYVCVGVCSQLQTMFAYVYHALRVQLASVLAASSNKNKNLENAGSVEKIETFLKQRNEYSIKKIHDKLLKKTGQTLILGNEYARVLSNGDLEEGRPIEGAYQAILDIRERKLPCQEYAICWPFDLEQETSYEMILQVVNKV